MCENFCGSCANGERRHDVQCKRGTSEGKLVRWKPARFVIVVLDYSLSLYLGGEICYVVMGLKNMGAGPVIYNTGDLLRPPMLEWGTIAPMLKV